jgi:hypothetical protein
MTEEQAPPQRILRGRKAILAWKDQLVELSHRCGQAGAMAQLEDDFARPAFSRKQPTLVLTAGRGPDGAEELESAVLLYEHRILEVGCRLFSADYLGATRTVIAPDGERACAAFAASEVLLQQGALLVHVSYEGDEPRLNAAGSDAAAQGHVPIWAIRQRQSIGYLRVEDTVEATLANLGKHTRRNLRHYRRRAEADLGHVAIDHPELTREEFAAFSRTCSYPLTAEQAAKRHEATLHMPSSHMYLGLRAANGDWLSLIGGRHDGPNTHIEWQMNRADMPSYSLCTLMRSHLIDYEVARGSKRVYFVGGTPHSIRAALVPDVKIADLLVVRGGLPRWALERLARPDSFVKEMLSNTALEWHPWQRVPLLPGPRRSAPQPLPDSSPLHEGP